MKTIKYFFRRIFAIYPIYAVNSVLVTILLLALGSPLTGLINWDIAVLIAGIPFLICVPFLGIPTYKKCKECGGRIGIRYQINTGDDMSHPSKYRHYFEVKECLTCGHKDSEHFIVDKKTNYRSIV